MENGAAPSAAGTADRGRSDERGSSTFEPNPNGTAAQLFPAKEVGLARLPTAAEIREVFNYNPETGEFTWRVARSSGVKPGDRDRYLRVNGVQFLAHRVAWFLVHGDWPAGELDHINCDRADNRIANLRVATRSQNQANCKVRRNNKSGLKGVIFAAGKWRARITKDRKNYSLGRFCSPVEAHEAYCRAAQKLFGEFWRAA